MSRYYTDDPAADAERWYCDQGKRRYDDEWDDLLGEQIAWERYCEQHGDEE